MAKIAQQTGVIKGILLHQGESNNTQQDWPEKVKKVYDRLIKDLGLNAADIPLFVGETVSKSEGGTCWGHNAVIATVPEVIPNSYVISSEGCPAKPEADGAIFHFTAEGYRMMGQRYAQKTLKLMGIEVELPHTIATPGLKPDKKFTSLQEIGTTPFAIVNEAEGKAFFGSNNQNLGYQDYETAFSEGNSGYLWKLENCNEVANGYLLRLITPQGTEYSIWGNRGYLNGFSTVADCSFVLGLNNQNGQDVANGAVWEINYVDDKGFTLKNKYTNKYLHDARSAQQVGPKYFTFCTLSETPTGISTVRYTPVIDDNIIYDLNGRRVNESTLRPGIYIKNRKKIVIR